jgi:hypothetical protein
MFLSWKTFDFDGEFGAALAPRRPHPAGAPG